MREKDRVGAIDQAFRHHGLVLVHVETGARDPTLSQGPDESLLIDHRTARRVDEVRRRLHPFELGLADPLVADRFWLWGLGGILGVIVLCTSVPPLFFPQQGTWMAVDLLVFGFAGTAACIPYALAFFPPKSYVEWVRGRAPQPAA